MKTYEVTTTAYRVMYIKAETEEDALEIASDETRMGELELDAIVAKEMAGEELERAEKYNRIFEARG